MVLKQQDKFRNDYLSFNLHEQDIRKEERIINLKNLMKNLGLTIEKAMDALSIPINEREYLRSILI